MLKCNIKGVENGYPLRIEVEKTEILSSDYDAGLRITVSLLSMRNLMSIISLSPVHCCFIIQL
jgi:hypothetical protein